MKLLLIILASVYANDFVADKFGYDIIQSNPEIISVLSTIVILLILRKLVKRQKK
jgi:hypothetical protein